MDQKNFVIFVIIKTLHKYRTLSLIIAIKRRNSNSKLLYKPKYILAKQFNLSPQTFCKLLESAIELGWIKKDSSGYQVQKLRFIFFEFHKLTGLYFEKNNILKSKDHDFHKILRDVEQIMVLDNIIRPQQYMIDKRKRYQWLPQPIQRTDNCAAQKEGEVAIDENGKPIPIPREKQKRGHQDVIRSSARGCAEKLGISQGKANKLLNTSKFYFRKQSYNVIHGFSHEKLAKTKLMNPFSVVYGVMKTNSIIIHHGSILSSRIVLPSHSSIMYIG